MAKTRKPKSAVEKQYDRQRNRIKRRVKALQERGYVFKTDPIPAKPKKITQASVRRLEKITPDTLYKKSYYIVDYITGELIPGEKGRKLERQKAQRKAQESKKRKAKLKKLRKEVEALKDKTGSFLPETTPKPSSKQYPLDEDVIIKNFMDMIDQWSPQGHWNAVFSRIKENDKNILRNILEGAINEEGKKAVAMRLEENAHEMQALFEEILYGSGDTEHDFLSGRKQVQLDLIRVATLLRGRSMTHEEAIQYMNAMEQDETVV